ncbi:MAG: hypothetical protein HYY04_14030 [Chloroflexi bacterium]|nr:hypothetical protein [Chloroflexota bacterium]
MDYLKAVDEIERLYPPERLAASKARWRAVWERRLPADRLPFVFISSPAIGRLHHVKKVTPATSFEQMLESQLQTIIDRADFDDDYIPSLFPGVRQGTIPSAYGAEEVFNGDHFWIRPIVADPVDVFDLPPVDLSRQGIAAWQLEMIRFFRSKTGGRLPIQMADMQGPVDLANNFFGTEALLLAMHTHPDAVHHLLDRVTDDFITFMHLMDEAAAGTLVTIHCLPTCWIPRGWGVGASEDLLAVLSPRLYPRFARPYNERIARIFDGVVLHSCGSFEHNLAELARTEGLIGVNFSASETSLVAVAEAVGDRATLLAHHSALSCHELPIPTPREHVDRSVDVYRSRSAVGPVLINPLNYSREELLEVSRYAQQATRLSERLAVTGERGTHRGVPPP